MNFSDFGFDSRVAAGVSACRYETPTPIQAQAIPSALKGADILGLAQTGTGKTAAFALPILNKLIGGQRGSLRAIILAPTRELAEQICDTFRKLGGTTKLSVTSVYGGVNIGPQIRSLRRGTDIVVACPGRLLDHMRQGTIDLRRVNTLVLDEADMMLDMGFLPDVRRILEKLPAQRQNMLFSATMPDAIRDLASDILREPVTAKIRHSRPVETVAHALYPVTQNLKTKLLLALLAKTESESVLVFTRTKHRAKKLGTLLNQQGHRAASLQGNLSQNARQAALDGFRRGRFDVLVATDIAARGIDVTQVSHVINYDLPNTVDAYTHRIGRTGRASKSGDAFSFVTREDEGVVRQIERVLGSRIERRRVDGFENIQIAEPQPPTSKSAEKQAPARKAAKPRRPENRAQNRAQNHVPAKQKSRGNKGNGRKRFSDERPRAGESRNSRGNRRSFGKKRREQKNADPGTQPRWAALYRTDEI